MGTGPADGPGGPVPYERSRCAEHRGGCTRGDVATVHPAHRGPHHVTARERTHRSDGTSSASHRRKVEWTGATRTSQNPVSTKFGEYPFQRLSGKSERTPIRGYLSLQNGAKWHLYGRFALPKNAPFDPHSYFPDSLSTHSAE